MGSTGKQEIAYTTAKNYIQQSGIPLFFTNNGIDATKQVFQAINDFGILSDDEQKIYDAIKTFMDEDGTVRLYYNGSNTDVTGFTEDEINGAKKWVAHSAYKATKRG